MSTPERRKKSTLSSKTTSGARTPPSRTKTRSVSKTKSRLETSSLTLPTRKTADKKEECSVRVAVHIRPLIQSELDDGCRECLKVTDKKTQVECCGNNYVFDKVYGECGGSPTSKLFGDYVQPLVDALYKGYNATIFAYGQIGSGKTFTMGSAFTPGETARGVIPSALDRIFERIQDKPNVNYTVRATFVEICEEGIRDLLAHGDSRLRLHDANALNSREVANSGVSIAGATEHEVHSKEEVGKLLILGTEVRATASTSMNLTSSRSHAIFTITLDQQKQAYKGDDCNEDCNDDKEEIREKEMEDAFLTAKMHLVDLGGSERVGRSNAEGKRFQEGIDTNRGLLALGKVISSLVSNESHVPYRDSKLTRFLQDSLGGNSRTFMIACVSPADIHAEETSNTLKYASQARKIKSIPVVNRDSAAAQLTYLRQHIAEQDQELAMYKKDQYMDISQFESKELELRTKMAFLEKRCEHLEDDKGRLKHDRDAALEEATLAKKKLLEAQSKDGSLKVQMKELHQTLRQLESEGTKLPESIDNLTACGNEDIIQEYVNKISELERENHELREFKEILAENFLQQRVFSERLKSAMVGVGDTAMLFDCSSFGKFPEMADVDCELDAKLKEAIEEEMYRLKQYKLGEEVTRLENNVKLKREQIDDLTSSSKEVEEKLRQQYKKQLQTLESKKQQLEKECEELRQRLQAIEAKSQEERDRLEQEYQTQLKEKEKELEDLKRQIAKSGKLEEMLKEATEAREKLKKDIGQMTEEKAQLEKQIKENEKEFNWQLALKDNQLGLLQRDIRHQKDVIERQERKHNIYMNRIQQSTEKGDEARNRLQDINKNPATPPPSKNKETSSGTSSSKKTNRTAPDDKSRREWLERELDTCNQGIIFKTILDSEVEQRKHAARLLRETEGRLSNIERCIQNDPGCTERYSKLIDTLQERKEEFKERREKHTAQIEEFRTKSAETKKEEEERDPNVEDKRWFSKLKSLTESREYFKALFMIASELKVQSHQHNAEKTRLEQEFAEVEEKLKASECKNEDLNEKLMRTKAALCYSSMFAPKITSTDTNNTHVVELLKRMERVAEPQNERDMTDVSSDKKDAPTVGASSLDLGSDSRDMNDADLENSSNEDLKPDLPIYTPEKEAEVLHCLNLRLAKQGKLQAQELTIPLMTQELMIADPTWERGNKTRSDLVLEVMTKLMSLTPRIEKNLQSSKHYSSSKWDCNLHNTSAQTKESQRRYEDTSEGEDGVDE